jgi:Amiloride-sensitive sodium channel
MHYRNMRHFFDEELYEAWYNLIVKDLDEILLKTVQQLAELKHPPDFPIARVGSTLLFGNSSYGYASKFIAFYESALICTLSKVRPEATQLLSTFQLAMHGFHSVSMDLFRKELGGYLAQFEFGQRFARENFVAVNVFLHKMNVELWRQEPTYSIWSLFCDVGGALGLFLGASLLTIIEVTYFIWQAKIYKRLQRGFWRGGGDELEAGKC